MGVPFGFSVGDLIAGIGVIQASIQAVQDSKGAAASYEALDSELRSLEYSPVGINELKIHPAGTGLYLDIDSAVQRCHQCIDTFNVGKAKYRPFLQRHKNRQQGPIAVIRKIQWALCKKEDIREFRAQLGMHSSAIKMLLIRLQTQQSCRHERAQETLQVTSEINLEHGVENRDYELHHQFFGKVHLSAK